MAQSRKPTPTRAYIIKIASELFFEKGFSGTTSTEISDKAGISKGNLTFYFPTKEHILSVLVEMMLDFQWREMEMAANEGKSSLLAYCLELTTLAALGEDLPKMQDLLAAAYSHPMTLDHIRANDIEKIKQVFSAYTTLWDEEKFTEIETIISGIEYATLMHTAHSATLAHRIEGALDSIMLLFGIPEKIRRGKIEKVLAMDYRAIAARVYTQFKQYVAETNAHALDESLKQATRRAYR